MNSELKSLAALALRNAFWHDFSALVNEYLEAAKEVDAGLQERLMGELTSIYGRNTSEKTVNTPNIWTQNDPGKSIFSTTGHDTILGALEHYPAIEVHLQGQKVFERRNGEWYFIG